MLKVQLYNAKISKLNDNGGKIYDQDNKGRPGMAAQGNFQ